MAKMQQKRLQKFEERGREIARRNREIELKSLQIEKCTRGEHIWGEWRLVRQDIHQRRRCKVCGCYEEKQLW